MAGSTFISKARPNRSAFSTGRCSLIEIADFLRVIKPYLEKSSKRDWNFYRHASETDALERHRSGVSARDRRDRRGLEIQGGRGRPVGRGRAQRQPGAAVLLRPLARQEGGKAARHPRSRQLQRVRRDGELYQGRPDRHGSQRLDQLCRRPALECDLRHQAGAGLAFHHGRPAGRDRQRRRLRRQRGRNHGHRDDDHSIRGLGPGRQARVCPGAESPPVQPVDRRLRADHARRQQRRLRQRLADRRQQDRRDRPPRAGPQEPRTEADDRRLLFRRQLSRDRARSARRRPSSITPRRRRRPTPAAVGGRP